MQFYGTKIFLVLKSASMLSMHLSQIEAKHTFGHDAVAKYY